MYEYSIICHITCATCTSWSSSGIPNSITTNHITYVCYLCTVVEVHTRVCVGVPCAALVSTCSPLRVSASTCC